MTALEPCNVLFDPREHRRREVPARAPARREQMPDDACDLHHLPAPRRAAATEAAASAAEAAAAALEPNPPPPQPPVLQPPLPGRLDQRPPLPKPISSETRSATTPAPSDAPSQLREDPGDPAGHAAPSRPSRERAAENPAQDAGDKDDDEEKQREQLADVLRLPAPVFVRRRQRPRRPPTPIMRSTPAEMPPAKSPRGTAA